MKYPIVSQIPEIQQHYVRCRRSGTSHQLAEMLALGRAPSLQTDTRWLAGHCNGNQFAGTERSEAVGRHYQRVARQAGVSTEGAVYKSQLARFPGDPQAWVRSKSDCIAIAAQRGMTLEGSVNYRPAVEREAPDPGPYRVADEIVDREYEILCDQQPDAAHADKQQVKDQIREKLSPTTDA